MLDVVFLDLFVFLFKPETKGKTLEEIEAMFDKVKHGYVTSRFVPMDLSFPNDSYPGSGVSYPLSISSYPTLWTILTQQIMTQNV